MEKFSPYIKITVNLNLISVKSKNFTWHQGANQGYVNIKNTTLPILTKVTESMFAIWKKRCLHNVFVKLE